MANESKLRTIKNYATFFDVTGLIDSEKRYFFVPNKENLQTGVPVCESFIQALTSVCPPPYSDYTNIELSRWSPEDRELVVKGDISMFRKGSSSKVLNYLIIKRVEVTPPPVRYHSYFEGYFIRNAYQTGINSVRLTLELDYFTNAFYLNNQNTLESGYEPFNDVIKNAYVERQHYDRFGVTRDDYVFDALQTNEVDANKLYVLKRQNNPSYAGIVINQKVKVYKVFDNNKEYIGTFNSFNFIRDEDKISFGIWSFLYSDYISQTDYYFGFIISDSTIIANAKKGLSLATQDKSYFSKNFDLFIKTAETFPYRQQNKIERVPLVAYKHITVGGGYNSHIDEVPSSAFNVTSLEGVPTYLASITPIQRKVIALACVKFLTILVRDKITYPLVIEDESSEEGGSDVLTFYDMNYYGTEYDSGNVIPTSQQKLVIPFISEPKGLEVFGQYFKTRMIFTAKTDFRFENEESYHLIETYSESKFNFMLAKLQERFGYYMQSIYISPYSQLSKNISVDLRDSDYTIVVKSNLVDGGRFTDDTRSISDNVENYHDECISKPTMVFIPKEMPAIDYEYNSSGGSTGIELIDNLIGAIDYYISTWSRKNLKATAKFNTTPSPLFYIETRYQLVPSPKRWIDSFVKASAYNNLILGCAFLVGDNEWDDCNYFISETIDLDDIPSTFYEPILEFEPYELNNFSFLEIETMIQKKRMIYRIVSEYDEVGNAIENEYFFKLKINQIVNNQYRLGLIPSYYYDTIWYRNYNDALNYVSSDGLTIRNNSYYDYTYQQQARMTTERFLVSLKGAVDIGKYVVNDMPYNIGSGALQGGWKGAIEGMGRSIRDISNKAVDYVMSEVITKMQQESELAGAGAKADSYACSGTNLLFDFNNDEYIIYRNKYRMDEVSYNSIAKSLERYGYRVDLYDKLNVYNRAGWNYIKLKSFDVVEDTLSLSEEQESTIDEMFRNGVTLIHDKSYINEEKHNIESELVED